MGEHPKIAAEKLLRSVLPEDLCISLSAIGHCEVQAKKHRYKIFKDQKTHCLQGKRVFSCCIHLSDPKAPDTDRIIAEYLLIKNDEEEYLKVANLTEIGPSPISMLRAMDEMGVRAGMAALAQAEAQNHALDAARYLTGQIPPPWLEPGGTIRMRRPTRFGERIPSAMITVGLLMELRHDERLAGRRWPNLREFEINPGWRRELLQVGMDFDDEALTQSFDDFRARIILPCARQLAVAISERPNLLAFFDLPIYGGNADMSARSVDPETGMKVSIHREYQIRHNQVRTVVAAGIILR